MTAEAATGEYEIINALGLHARAAAQLVKIANRYPCEVWLECEGESVNGKSIMGVLMLAAARGTIVTVKTDGEQARECADAIAQLFDKGFNEGVG